jgi:hypothetical protein
MDTSHSDPNRKSYDLSLRAGERRLVWSTPDPDHGLTLTDHDIAWIAGGRQSQASLRDIVEVHLQIGYFRNDAIASCRLRFADGSTVLISSESSGGSEDAALDELYSEFVYDLHARLATRREARIAFTSGFSEGRYLFGRVIAVVGGLFFVVTPIVLLLITGDWKAAVVTYSGVVFLWPLYKIMQADAPRCYDPGHVPPELLPARLNLPPLVHPALLDSD